MMEERTMSLRRAAVALILAGFLVVRPPWASDARAAAPGVNDLTDFIQRLGGYLFTITDTSVPSQIFWEQVSYKVATASNSNITTITMTKYNKAAVYISTGNGMISPAPLTSTSTNPSAFNLCAADDYIVDTVMLDLRDLKSVSTKTSGLDDQQHPIWSVVLQKNGENFIRKNTQALPANCASANHQPKTKIVQQDVNQYPIVFADEGQANQFQKLVTNVIPTLNPPTFIGPTPGQ
jgi:hypothetical protein